ncbi:alpha/beta fold hydrolase [Mesorhizobium captivum]|uniref:alpha/beta fold hydrolase n=1 Tax=Mesorhizobium captivum TaxID=3072319 RepID=UPI002A23F34F|nr:alpha/beta hydrolase [Mesorhizobium sp. VK22E]MDX8504550.1 alpha/beta hydrolase [Mesorhizobium sp. VK22E]
MSEPIQRIIETNGIRLNIAEHGDGPLVLLCHGFPESWYSWRHQLGALAAAGFRAVAPDMRGYGKSDRPEAIDQYTLFHLVGDMVGLLDAIEAPTSVIVGHDWGAVVAWYAALLRPDRFHAVIGLSVPFRPRGNARPTSLMPRTADSQFYQLYFQQPGVAEAELERDPRATLRAMLYAASGDASAGSTTAGAGISMVPHGRGLLQGVEAPPNLPHWLSERDLDFYTGEFRRTGFAGGLNWYRNIDRNWELMAPFAGARIKVPAFYIAGDRDLVIAFPGMDQLLANLRNFVPQIRDTLVLPGCGHWTQQERPDKVNAAVIEFLRSLPNRD